MTASRSPTWPSSEEESAVAKKEWSLPLPRHAGLDDHEQHEAEDQETAGYGEAAAAAVIADVLTVRAPHAALHSALHFPAVHASGVPDSREEQPRPHPQIPLHTSNLYGRDAHRDHPMLRVPPAETRYSSVQHGRRRRPREDRSEQHHVPLRRGARSMAVEQRVVTTVRGRTVTDPTAALASGPQARRANDSAANYTPPSP